MDNNQNNQNNNNKNRKNINGVLILVAWAVALTVVFNYLSAANRQANTAASTHEILYTEMLDMVESDQVAQVLLVDGRLEITPVEGYVYTDEDGNTYDDNYTLFTMPISASIGDLIDLIHEHGGEFSYPYVPEMSPVLEFMIAYILPLVLMIGGFMLIMNLMARKGGGIGGIGSVGKSNAKVYMEKSTGVTFNDVAGQDEANRQLRHLRRELPRRGHFSG